MKRLFISFFISSIFYIIFIYFLFFFFNFAPPIEPVKPSLNLSFLSPEESMFLQEPLQESPKKPLETPLTKPLTNPQTRSNANTLQKSLTNTSPTVAQNPSLEQEDIFADLSQVFKPSAKTAAQFSKKTSKKQAQSIQALQNLYKNTNLSPAESEFLEKNIEKIAQITQEYLNDSGYPSLGKQFGVGGDNLVEFYLYPNGDISDIVFIRFSGYSYLDSHTKNVIELAYKDYPLPKEKTRIRIRFFYEILY